MSSFTFYSNIPTAQQDPSVSQGEILQNFTSIGASAGSWVTQDHYGFGTGTDGQHQFINFPENNAIGSQTGLASAVNTIAGTANTGASKLVFTNSSGSFPISPIVAFGTCPGNVNGAVTLSNGYNISSINTTSGNWTTTVNMPSGIVTGTSYLVIANAGSAGFANDQILVQYNIVSSTSFQLKTVNVATNAVSSCSYLSFMVLQI